MYMEKRIKNKLDKQQIKFKTDIQEWVNDNNIFSIVQCQLYSL